MVLDRQRQNVLGVVGYTTGSMQAYRQAIFLGGEPSLPENFFDRTRKNCFANLQNYFPDSPTQYYISKNPGFRAFYLARQNEFCFFRLINTKKYFSLWLLWLLPEKFSFCPKIMALPESAASATRGSYAYMGSSLHE